MLPYCYLILVPCDCFITIIKADDKSLCLFYKMLDQRSILQSSGLLVAPMIMNISLLSPLYLFIATLK